MATADAPFLLQLENLLNRFAAQQCTDEDAVEKSIRILVDLLRTCLSSSSSRKEVAKQSFRMGVRIREGSTIVSIGPEFETKLSEFFEDLWTISGFPEKPPQTEPITRRITRRITKMLGQGTARPAALAILQRNIRQAVLDFTIGQMNARQTAERLRSIGIDHALDSAVVNKTVGQEVELAAKRRGLAFRMNDSELVVDGKNYSAHLHAWLEAMVRQNIVR